MRITILFCALLGVGCETAAVAPPPTTPHPYHAVDNGHFGSVDQLRTGEINRFEFSNWRGTALPVWMFVPDHVDPQVAPILFVMHGAKRDPHRYLREWIEPADRNGLIIIAPEFSRDDFPGSGAYNRGGVLDDNGNRRDEAEWSFSAIEPLFDQVRTALESSRNSYSMYGHSAGSQFVHRFLFFKPQARVDRYIAANAGWYTFPSADIDFPYGLRGSGVTQQTIRNALAKQVIVLLGDADTDPNHSSLRRSPDAMRQGAHRFARGLRFFESAEHIAASQELPFQWSLDVVEGVAHSNGGMASAAAEWID
ncbi:MAG: alpha/beta hydrolase [Pseudomonadota bacterium]